MVVGGWTTGFAPLALAALCGIDVGANGAGVIASVQALTAAFGPAATAEHTLAADRAVVTLADLLDSADRIRRLRLTGDVTRSATDCQANEIGWFFQSFDACTALIGCSLAALIPIISGQEGRALDED